LRWPDFLTIYNGGLTSMTTLATRIREVCDLEGFDIEVFNPDGTLADLKQNGFPAYPHERKSKGQTTVSEWKNRFHAAYPALTCNVLDADGKICNGNTKLESVRETYSE